MKLDLFHPVLNRLKGLTLIDCVCKDNTHCATIVSLSDSFEALLSSSVPNLESNLVLADVNGFDFEINADGGKMGGHEIILGKSE
jgi:hypothetical protein